MVGIALSQAWLHIMAPAAHSRWLGVDGHLLFGGLALIVALGLLRRSSRRTTAVIVMMVIAYTVSDQRLRGTLELDVLWFVPVAAMALFIFWPRLIEVRPRED